MGDWDWDGIDVASGEWWLLLLFLAAVALAFLGGMAVEDRRLRRRGYNPPPSDLLP